MKGPSLSGNPISSDHFRTLFDHYYSGLVAYAMEFSLRREEAEDVIQDIFVTLWKKRGETNTDGIKTYLFRSTRNGCLNYLSHLKVRSGYQEKILRVGASFADKFEPDHYVESTLDSLLSGMIDKLPPQRRAVFIKKHLEEKSVPEIAQELSISPKTVYNHLDLAYKFFKATLSREDLMILFLILCNCAHR